MTRKILLAPEGEISAWRRLITIVISDLLGKASDASRFPDPAIFTFVYAELIGPYFSDFILPRPIYTISFSKS